MDFVTFLDDVKPMCRKSETTESNFEMSYRFYVSPFKHHKLIFLVALIGNKSNKCLIPKNKNNNNVKREKVERGGKRRGKERSL